MKSSIRVCNMNDLEDVNNVRRAISGNEGVVACEISLEKGEANVVYDDFFVNIDKIIESIEDLGYTVL
ncbi:MAG: heavy-metal-associated domain-containing protein [Bacillota bacterium]|nr:heavy-metal-associated domain-containing protein [Bacillota bacterium]